MRLTIRRGTLPTGAVVAGSAIALGGIVRLLHLDLLPVPLCTFRAVTGIPCFSCGATRAVGLLARLDLPGAFLMQPLITAIVVGIGLWGVSDLVLFFAAGRRALGFECTGREGIVVAWIFFGLAVANWIYLINAGR